MMAGYIKPWIRWAVLWRSECLLDGKVERLQGENSQLPLFATRREAREYIEERYGYIRQRPDLQREPHGWKMPIPVKVSIAPLPTRQTRKEKPHDQHQ